MLKLIKKYLHRGQDRSVLAALQTTTTTTTNNISRKKKEKMLRRKAKKRRRQWKITIPHGFCGPETKRKRKSESSRWASVFFFGSFTACYVSITNATRPWLRESYLLSTTLSTREVHKFGFFTASLQVIFQISGEE